MILDALFWISLAVVALAPHFFDTAQRPEWPT